MVRVVIQRVTTERYKIFKKRLHSYIVDSKINISYSYQLQSAYQEASQ